MGNILGTWYILIHGVLPVTPYYLPHFTNKETESQSHKVTFQGHRAAEGMGLEPRQPGSKARLIAAAHANSHWIRARYFWELGVARGREVRLGSWLQEVLERAQTALKHNVPMWSPPEGRYVRYMVQSGEKKQTWCIFNWPTRLLYTPWQMLSEHCYNCLRAAELGNPSHGLEETIGTGSQPRH